MIQRELLVLGIDTGRFVQKFDIEPFILEIAELLCGENGQIVETGQAADRRARAFHRGVQERPFR